ncbi:MAG: branched-chain amino acid ABC transporter permease [Deltaproteobacteria bacterium]|nr:branched-chain amino acid ABC transporter permease [Deltaproteobacteria bacterium]
MSLGAAIQLTAGGVSAGCLYALVALGLHLVFKATKAINFAHGEQVMVSGLVALTLAGPLGLPLPAAFALTVLFGAGFGWLYERALIRRVLSEGHLSIILLSVAVAIVLENGGALLWGKEPQPFRGFSGDEPVSVLGAGIHPQTFWVVGLTAVSLASLHWFFTRTAAGTAIEAAANNPTAARLVGISPERATRHSFVIASALAAAVGITGAPLLMVGGSLGTVVALKGFAALVVGGQASSLGVVLGGLLLGLLEFFSAFFLSQGYRDAVSFAVLIAVLLFRPQGLFARAGGAG